MMLIVMTTVPTLAAGEHLAEKIVQTKLAACVQILPQMTSVYVWKGRITKQGEHLLMIKTLSDKYDELRAFITANHSYQIPEIASIRVEKASFPYLAWMSDALTLTKK